MTKIVVLDHDFSNCNLDQLLQMEKNLNTAIDKRRQEKIEQCRQQILVLCVESGVSLVELVKPLLEDQAYFVKKRHVATALPVLYRHPENSTWTWTGKGRKPLWLTDWLAKGGKLESLSVTENKPT